MNQHSGIAEDNLAACWLSFVSVSVLLTEEFCHAEYVLLPFPQHVARLR